jgi:3-oxoadipate enol-lactonase
VSRGPRGRVGLADGTELAVERSGARSGPAVVLVHAGIADMRMWEPLVHVLPAGLDVVRYDMRGFGGSPLLPGTVSNARDLIGLLDALEIGQATLVGASFGGRVALEVASNWPERVRGLALLDAALPSHDWSVHFSEYDAAEEEALEQGDITGAVELNLRMWVDGARVPSEVDPAVRALVGDMQRRIYELQEGVDAELEPIDIELSRIGVPAVVVVGEYDVPDFHAIARELAEGIPNATGPFVVAGAAHLPALERPAETAELIAPVL